MKFKTKRSLAYILVGIYLFLGGIEYAVILPSAWEYLQSLGATDEFYLGLSIAGYSISGTVAGLVGGRVSDLYPHHTKWIVIVCTLTMILGNIMYMLGMSVVNIIISRILCGFGSGAGATLLAEVCRTTNQKERTAVLSICNGTRQIGILMGPACQLFLALFHFNFVGFEVNRLNAAGLFMASVWTLFFILFVIMYSDIYHEYKYDLLRKQFNPEDTGVLGHSMYLTSYEEEKKRPKKNNVEVASLGKDLNKTGYGSLGLLSDSPPASSYTEEERNDTPYSEDYTLMDRDGSVADTSSYESDAPLLGVTPRGWFFVADVLDKKHAHAQHITYRTYLKEFLHDDVVVLFMMNMFCFFAQLNVETIIAPLLQYYFNFNTWITSFVYMGGGFVSIAVYVSVAFFSKHIRDSVLLAVGWTILIAANIWFLVFIPQFVPGDLSGFPYFLVGGVLLFMGFTISGVSSAGLMSKCVSEGVQGAAQGLRRVATFIGLIIGPMWGSATMRDPYLQFSVPIGVLVFTSVLYMISLPKIVEEETERRVTDD